MAEPQEQILAIVESEKAAIFSDTDLRSLRHFARSILDAIDLVADGDRQIGVLLKSLYDQAGGDPEQVRLLLQALVLWIVRRESSDANFIIRQFMSAFEGRIVDRVGKAFDEITSGVTLRQVMMQ